MVKRLLILLLTIIFIWIILTLWVEMKGAYHFSESGSAKAVHRALIIFDPDPFYNLDFKICNAYAQTLSSAGWNVTLCSVRAFTDSQTYPYDLYIICANTYNWSPDWAVTDWIKEKTDLKDKNTVAITLGAGSTANASRKLERLLTLKGANMVDSRTWWLWRPNDKQGTGQSNVETAVEQAKKAAAGIASSKFR